MNLSDRRKKLLESLRGTTWQLKIEWLFQAIEKQDMEFIKELKEGIQSKYLKNHGEICYPDIEEEIDKLAGELK